MLHFKESGESIILSIITHLQNLFASLYESCGSKGKEKFAQFQMKWHQHCSTFLLPNTAESFANTCLQLELSRIQERWIGYCHGKSVAIETRNAVMISVCAAVYEFLLGHCSTLQQSITDKVRVQTEFQATNSDDDAVYYRFCGAAMASMLHARYKKRDMCKPSLKGSLNREIAILRAIKCSDKTHIPPELQYRDRGFMYFPTEEFIGFLRAVDVCVKENANVKALERYGSKLVEITTQQVRANQELEVTFNSLISSKLALTGDNIEVYAMELASVYAELTRKLCNTRIQEFLDSHHQISVAKQGSATTSGLNLRDNLLPMHTNLKSTIN